MLPNLNGTNFNTFIGGSFISFLVGAGISLLIAIIVWWVIFAKAGYPGALAILMIIPLVNLIVFLVFLFGEWPVRKELKALRQQVQQARASYPQSGFGQAGYQSGPNYPPYPQNPQYRQ
jgi:hypothetical protein